MSQRLVRAKSKIRQAGIPFRIPEPEELPSRLNGVLDAIYATFAEGWIDAAGTDVARRDLAGEAIFLCKVVTELLPDEPEALGLLSLMLHAEARRPARRGPHGEYVPLAAQDPDLWNEAMIGEAEAALFRSSVFASMSRFQLEAAIQSAHVARRRTGISNWADVVQLYDALLTISGSPVVAINRALAVAESEGPARGLQALEKIAADRRLEEYQPYWAARAELLTKTGKWDDARHAYEIAIGLERDPAVRKFLQERREQISSS
jgi:RNA polymerase sigma-70 factor (ECF subfamily)